MSETRSPRGLFTIHLDTRCRIAARQRTGAPPRGYGRLTDGDPATFWKSNPYLTKAFTGEDDALHPQWIVVDLLAPLQINALRIDWCEPSARVYEVQHWTGVDP